ncbi:MAG: DAK2 domain-containing protein [Oscillospiraceae bacterium]|nr:DAK2 domain-containing protein [Oscillospiraceae bacterium]
MLRALQIKNAFERAAALLWARRAALDGINVFPVADGDTGSNMYHTMNAAAGALSGIDENCAAYDALHRAAQAALYAGSGNSGVILSVMLGAFANCVAHCATLSAQDIVRGFTDAAKAGYKAVENPVDGTMLTVANAVSQSLSNRQFDSVEEVLTVSLNAACHALALTQHQLPALEKAGVVDAGGLGLCLILEGLLGASDEDNNVALSAQAASKTTFHNGGKINKPGKKSPIYCVDFLLKPVADRATLQNFLVKNSESLVVTEYNGIVKVHLHCHNPDDIFDKTAKYGDIISENIDMI